jgi:ABC-type branched-subunit amino acid transport system permease subunit
MSAATQFYITTLLVYFGVDVLACWGLNLQFGVAGVINFAYIIFQALGAYIVAVLTLGPSSGNGGFQHYALGSNLPFLLALVLAMAAGGLLGVVVGCIGLRRLRSDYEAMVMLVVSVIATTVVTNDAGLFNGPAGLSLVPQPMLGGLGLDQLQYSWFYVGMVVVICLIAYFFIRRLTESPFGRLLRAVRDNEQSVVSLGKNVAKLRLLVFGFGGAIAALSGGLLVGFIGAWSPGAWVYVETFTLFTAVIVGGLGNNLGVVVGALLVPVAFSEGARYLPGIGGTQLAGALQWIAIGLLALIFLWFRPRGIIPERRHRYPASAPQSLAGLALGRLSTLRVRRAAR